jgi:dTDP-4-amino-4,6-dideoxygalactose transaminase
VLRTPESAAVGVPFLDLGSIHAGLVDDILDEFRDVVASGAFTNGAQVALFESAYASYCATEECVGLASGLDALRLALEAAGIGAGDEVIVPANTFVATFEAVAQAGAIPVPVDVRDDDYNIDVEAAASALTERTAAILPVHLYGQLANMRAVSDLAERRGLFVLEDACQAHGAERDGIRAGAAGDAAAFSFYPGKNLGAFGDAGAATTDDGHLAGRMRMLREHGQRAKYVHELVGYTARLDTLQALVLLHKLPHLDSWNDARRRIACSYDAALAGVGDLRLPQVPLGSAPVWHLYVIRTERRQALTDYLRERGIGTGMHYPQAAHLSDAFAWLGHRPGSFRQAERLAGEVLSLPIFPGMTDDQVATVVAGVRGFFSRG